MSEQVTCSCGKWLHTSAGYVVTVFNYCVADENLSYPIYCAGCGDKLNADGTVESRKQLVKDKDDAIERGLMAYLDCQEKLLAVVSENEQLKARVQQEASK